jgi:hypothetical protein
MCRGEYYMGFGPDEIGFTDHLYTQLVPTSNDSSTANLHTLTCTCGSHPQ